MVVEFVGFLANPGHEKPGCKFSGVLSTHAIGNSEHEVGGVEEDFTRVGKWVGRLRVDREDE